MQATVRFKQSPEGFAVFIITLLPGENQEKGRRKMKKLKKIIFYGTTVLAGSTAFASAMTFRNVTKEVVGVFIGSMLWLGIAAIEGEKKEGAAE